MLYERVIDVDWVYVLTSVCSGIVMTVIFLVFIWVVPLLLNALLRLSPLSQKLRQGLVILLRTIFAFSGVFLVGDAFGLSYSYIVNVLTALFGIGVSWAIKDNISNAFSGIIIFLSRSYCMGDHITGNGFDGVICGFHVQYVKLEPMDTDVEIRDYIYVPNSRLWDTVVRVKRGRMELRHRRNPTDEIFLI